MDIASEVEKLTKGGCNKDAARAKVAHGIVLAAIRAAGFKEGADFRREAQEHA